MNGRVIDNSGLGLPAVVYISDINGKPVNDNRLQTLADEQGYYQLNDFAGQGLYVTASLTGWNTKTELAAYGNVNITLTPGNNTLPEANIIETRLKRQTPTLIILSAALLGILIYAYNK